MEYELLYKKIKRIAMNYTYRKEDIEDITQESIIRIFKYKYLDNIPPGLVNSFLKRITFASVMRLKKGFPSSKGEELGEEEDFSPEKRIDEFLFENSIIKLVMSSGNIPKEQAHIFIDLLLNGFDIGETAKKFNLKYQIVEFIFRNKEATLISQIMRKLYVN